HRYLDASLRLPDALRPHEAELRGAIAGRVGRGKLDASLHMSTEAADGSSLPLNRDVARQLIKAGESIAAELQNAAPIDPLSVLRWPGVLEAEEPETKALLPVVRKALDQAIGELCEARAREGEKISGMLESRCTEILQLVAEVRTRLPQVLTDIRARLLDRIQSLDLSPDPERLEQEIALLAQKMDVSEELDRLDAHVAEVRTTLAQSEPVGRRLDFLMQELNREANTLASKSADKETTRQSVDLKVVIEQMREQVQNVE
ncbi:MAG: YicC/YloC family endoribonuclease, partial [Gammaproteobacteria bacterium]